MTDKRDDDKPSMALGFAEWLMLGLGLLAFVGGVVLLCWIMVALLDLADAIRGSVQIVGRS